MNRFSFDVVYFLLVGNQYKKVVGQRANDGNRNSTFRTFIVVQEQK